ncbi:MAG: Phosphate binding protein [Phenylobacterium sp.]|jgi:phosphate transport system substrate-binding protein|nr:Phosphate binding protein [Phenylobacterium sp.]
MTGCFTRKDVGRTRVARVCLQALLASVAWSSSALAAAAVDPDLPAYRPAEKGVAAPAHGRYVDAAGAVRIAGADNARVIVEGFDALFAKTHPGAKFSLDLKGTGTGIPNLTHGVAAFVVMGRGVTPNELVPYTKIVGAKPLEIRIAHTAYASQSLATSLAVYVNQANPISRLTLADVSRMFTADNPGGDATSWGQVGETGPWAKARIHPVAGSMHAGFGSYLEAVHFANRPLAPQVEEYGNTGDVLKRVGEDSLAVGIAATGRTDPGVKVVALAVEPGGAYSTGVSADVVADRYPFGRYLYVYVRREPNKPLDPLVREYLRLVLSKDGQEIIAAQSNGYLPLSAKDAALEMAKLEKAQ